ncbi:heterogeneous nuclear ribonucleoprotein A3-like [Onthophagus taurus]|uniref:heterogeneous nuclear ribonucleoprotein A3-like n=1 Tax=Onthophagus taurus TaxID=166361 RepID=UPI000C1FF2A2|nr:shematrin-like protein 2 isoform X2 [Onthophagus taurus]
MKVFICTVLVAIASAANGQIIQHDPSSRGMLGNDLGALGGYGGFGGVGVADASSNRALLSDALNKALSDNSLRGLSNAFAGYDSSYRALGAGNNLIGASDYYRGLSGYGSNSGYGGYGSYDLYRGLNGYGNNNLGGYGAYDAYRGVNGYGNNIYGVSDAYRGLSGYGNNNFGVYDNMGRNNWGLRDSQKAGLSGRALLYSGYSYGPYRNGYGAIRTGYPYY